MSNLRDIKIRFEFGQEDRSSEDMGPFPFAQLTYDDIRVGEDGDRFIAHFADGFWKTEDGQLWSDVVIFGVSDAIVDATSQENTSFKLRAISAADDAISNHIERLQLEPGHPAETNLWHLLASLKNWAVAKEVDFEKTVADVLNEHKIGTI